MSSPPSRFVIVPEQRQSRWRGLLLVVLWLASLAAAGWASHRWSVPLLPESLDRLDALSKENLSLQVRLENELQRSTGLARSDQVSRDAVAKLQEILTERDEEIAALRADVAFYERLVGGSAKRQGLTVHSVRFRAGDAGDLRFEITLTQNLKQSGLTRGRLSLSIDGLQDGALASLDWSTLRQQPRAEAVPFEFRYFQQLDGSVMMPKNFTPHRVRVTVDRDGATMEESIPWEDTQKT